MTRTILAAISGTIALCAAIGVAEAQAGGSVVVVTGAAAANAARSAQAQTITGPAHVIDGDTIEIAGQRIRMAGIDAPEVRQPCFIGSIPCGEYSRNILWNQTAARIVTCLSTERDRYGRAVGTCSVPGIADLGLRMVETGYAVRYPQYDTAGRYTAAEAEAKREKRGLWAGEFEMPWDWRHRHKHAEGR